MSAPTWLKKIAPPPPPRQKGRIVRLVTPPKPLKGLSAAAAVLLRWKAGAR